MPSPVCFVYRLRPTMAAEYERLHAATWPVAEAELARCGWLDYRIYRRDDLIITVARRLDDAVDVPAPPHEQAELHAWHEAVGRCLEEFETPDHEPLYADQIYHWTRSAAGSNDGVTCR